MDPSSRKVASSRYIWEHDEFKAHIANQPLNRREIAALEGLSKYGVGAPADFRQIKIGLETRERLEARGFLETRPQKKFPDRVGFYLLTEEGLKAWETRRDDGCCQERLSTPAGLPHNASMQTETSMLPLYLILGSVFALSILSGAAAIALVFYPGRLDACRRRTVDQLTQIAFIGSAAIVALLYAFFPG